MPSATTGEPRRYSGGLGSNLQTDRPVVAFSAYTVPFAVFVAKRRSPPATVMDACTGPFGAKDHFGDPVATSNAQTRPLPPKELPPTNTVLPESAGDEMPESTKAFQSSIPEAPSIAYTSPCFEGTITREPAMTGDAATEPAVG